MDITLNLPDEDGNITAVCSCGYRWFIKFDDVTIFDLSSEEWKSEVDLHVSDGTHQEMLGGDLDYHGE